jgi:hypothetical protein
MDKSAMGPIIRNSDKQIKRCFGGYPWSYTYFYGRILRRILLRIYFGLNIIKTFYRAIIKEHWSSIDLGRRKPGSKPIETHERFFLNCRIRSSRKTGRNCDFCFWYGPSIYIFISQLFKLSIQDASNEIPCIAVACGHSLLIYRNMKPYYRFV